MMLGSPHAVFLLTFLHPLACTSQKRTLPKYFQGVAVGFWASIQAGKAPLGLKDEELLFQPLQQASWITRILNLRGSYNDALVHFPSAGGGVELDILLLVGS